MKMLRRECARMALAGAVVAAVGSWVEGGRADITRWDNGQVIPGTVGITPGPGINLSNMTLEYARLTFSNLSNALLADSDLSFANLTSSNLTFAALTGCNLSNANLASSNLSQANLANATIAGANLQNSGITLTQLMSTLSYLQKNLQGIQLSKAGAESDLHGADLSGFNLSGSRFYSTNFAGASLVGVNLANSTLDTPDFTGADLTAANLSGTKLIEPNLANSTITGANFSNSTISNYPISQTKNYALKNLVNINFSNLDFRDSNLSGQDMAYSNFNGTNLSSSNFSNAYLLGTTVAKASLTSCNFSNATLISVDLSNLNVGSSNFTNSTVWACGLANATFAQAAFANADFSDSDVRAANGWSPANTTITNNMILTDGSIAGLSMSNGEELIVRNYPVAITAKTSAKFVAGSTIDFVLDGSAWGSTISFASGVVPLLDGTMELDLAAGVDPSLNIGRSYTLFNWGAGLASGDRFASIVANAPAGYVWDTSHLYRTGVVTLWADPAAVPEAGSVGVLGMVVLGVLRRGKRGRD